MQPVHRGRPLGRWLLCVGALLVKRIASEQEPWRLLPGFFQGFAHPARAGVVLGSIPIFDRGCVIGQRQDLGRWQYRSIAPKVIGGWTLVDLFAFLALSLLQLFRERGPDRGRNHRVLSSQPFHILGRGRVVIGVPAEHLTVCAHSLGRSRFRG